MKRILFAVGLATALPVAAWADDVTNTLESAIAAYEEGDIAYALSELSYAQQLLRELQTGALTGFLPPAPEGWTREIDEEAGMGLGMMGGGSATAARYSGPGGAEFSIMMSVDSPMLAMVAPMLANAAAMGVRVERVGRERFANQNGELMGLIAGRIFIQASGAEHAVMIPVLEQIDFAALAGFGG